MVNFVAIIGTLTVLSTLHWIESGKDAMANLTAGFWQSLLEGLNNFTAEAPAPAPPAPRPPAPGKNLTFTFFDGWRRGAWGVAGWATEATKYGIPD